MIRSILRPFILVGLMTSYAIADPTLTMVPLGLQSGNWVWRVDITPDLTIVPAAANGTPVALEFGFRLTGSPLATVANINPSVFDTSNPGRVIFGWEMLDPSSNNRPRGLQSNTLTSEVFAAFGTIDIMTPGPRPFLQFTALGPDNGGAIFSTIQWFGAYPSAGPNGQGLISQINGGTSPNWTVGSYLFSGSATQIPEPASLITCSIAGLIAASSWRRRPWAA